MSDFERKGISVANLSPTQQDAVLASISDLAAAEHLPLRVGHSDPALSTEVNGVVYNPDLVTVINWPGDPYIQEPQRIPILPSKKLIDFAKTDQRNSFIVSGKSFWTALSDLHLRRKDWLLSYRTIRADTLPVALERIKEGQVHSIFEPYHLEFLAHCADNLIDKAIRVDF